MIEQAVAIMARPDDVLQLVVMHNFSNEKGEVVLTRYELGSWVTLRPNRSEKRRGRQQCSGWGLQDWKAHIINFMTEVIHFAT
jgi:hypothetical protein